MRNQGGRYTAPWLGGDKMGKDRDLWGWIWKLWDGVGSSDTITAAPHHDGEEGARGSGPAQQPKPVLCSFTAFGSGSLGFSMKMCVPKKAPLRLSPQQPQCLGSLQGWDGGRAQPMVPTQQPKSAF